MAGKMLSSCHFAVFFHTVTGASPNLLLSLAACLQNVFAALVAESKQLNWCHVILTSSDFGFLDFMAERGGKDAAEVT